MKKPQLSVIVPTYNSAAYLEQGLKSLREQKGVEFELIVVDNNSKDATKDIAKKYADTIINQGPERSAQRNAGVEASSGQYLFIPDSDMVAPSGLLQAIVEAFEAQTTTKALVIPEESFGEGFWAQCKKLERSFYVGVEWMEAARAFRRDIFEEMHGYDEKNTGTEDYDLPQRIEKKYGAEAIGRTTVKVLHNEQRINLTKTCRKKFYYAQKLDSYTNESANLGKFKKQSSIVQRYLLFVRNPLKLLKNPLLGFGMLYMKTTEFAAGASGYIFAKLKKSSS